MLTEVEDFKRVYVVISTKSGREYHLQIFKEKYDNEYRIINLTRGIIYPCKFGSFQEAEDDIYKYQAEGRNEILDIYSALI